MSPRGLACSKNDLVYYAYKSFASFPRDRRKLLDSLFSPFSVHLFSSLLAHTYFFLDGGKWLPTDLMNDGSEAMAMTIQGLYLSAFFFLPGFIKEGYVCVFLPPFLLLLSLSLSLFLSSSLLTSYVSSYLYLVSLSLSLSLVTRSRFGKQIGCLPFTRHSCS